MGYLLDVQLLRLHHYMGLSDNAMVTLILNIGVSLLLVFVVVFLGVQSLLEGAGAIEGAYNWIQTYIDGLSLLWLFSPSHHDDPWLQPTRTSCSPSPALFPLQPPNATVPNSQGRKPAQ